MGFRFRKSVKLFSGVRLNFSKSGVSTSIGRPGATLNVGSRGSRLTAGIPGTGISYSEQLSNEAPSERSDNVSTLGSLIVIGLALLVCWFVFGG